MFWKNRKDEAPILSEIIAQAFSAQDARIKLQEEKIAAIADENAKLKEANRQLWEVLKKMDDKLSVVYGQVFGAQGDDVSIAEWKYGEGNE